MKTANAAMMKTLLKKTMESLHALAKKNNTDYENIVQALKHAKAAKGKTSGKFDPWEAAELIVPYVEDHVEKVEGNGKAGLFTDTQILDIAYEVAETHAKHLDEQTATKAKTTLNEGGIKASMEDWIEALPDAVVKELKSKHGQALKEFSEGKVQYEKTVALRKKIKELLVKHKVEPLLGDKSHNEGALAVLISFHSYLGDVNESTLDDYEFTLGVQKKHGLVESLVQGGLKKLNKQPPT